MHCRYFQSDDMALLYERSISLENTGDNPYLFSLQSAWDRGMSSSQWTSTVHTPLVLNDIVPF